MTTPGETYDTGVATIGGRGQQATVPYETPQHILTITRTVTSKHEDHFITAQAAIAERISRLREQGRPFTRDGMTLIYTDFSGAHVTLEYEEP